MKIFYTKTKLVLVILFSTASMAATCTTQETVEVSKSGPTFFQQFERSIGKLVDDIFELHENIDELIPFLLELASMYSASHLVYRTDTDSNSNQIIELIKRLGIGFIIQGLITLVHETGHAIAAKLCNQKNIVIKLGKNNPQGSRKPINFKVGSLSYQINSPYIINGKICYTEGEQKLNRLQSAFIALAGGSAAAAALYLIKVVAHLNNNRSREYPTQKERLKEALYQSLKPDSSTMLQVTNMLVPLDPTNDGTLVWKAILNK